MASRDGGSRAPETRGRQLTFDLTRDPGFAADDFLVSPSNAEAFERIDRWPDWPVPTLVLVGPAGSGKSHLGALWAEAADALVIDRTAPLDPVLAAGRSAILLEDCDRTDRPDASLFHLINLTRESGSALLLTARRMPDLWPIGTRDLLSRLRLAPSVAIGHPDAHLIRAVLVKLFADRQIKIEADVVTYAALHLDQSLDAAARFVAAVDEASLAEGRRITRALAAATIATLAPFEP